ncbi:Crp/Fnr family transcriptional regulator [Fusobacterium sp.]|uniref:Crp/Fnr family transcriptional regulator n=1 Tax=Fusobacterium sp. TaxID=68766 RepID=UPI0029015AAE|nr:Crp/Fnr family transcriptional regulator [Fusobacterium sp.]MDU1909797.1 Crp/Fnr family transcriptional regulator [Fusobacterium sp.]
MSNSENGNFFSESFPFWNELSSDEKKLIDNNTELKLYKAGTTIHDSTECTGVLLIKKGELRVYILSPEGREVTLYRLGEKETCLLTASCILKNITFSIMVDAETDSKVFLISSAAFKELKNKNIQVESFTNDIMNCHFSETMWAMEQILFTSFDKRLAFFLLEQSKEKESEILNFTHEYIAKNLGSAREVVSRMLKYFQTEGIVSLSRGSIIIKNKKKLEALK